MFRSTILPVLLQTRLGRGVGTLVILAALYSVYVVVITPLVEPVILAGQRPAIDSGITPKDLYREQMADLFPEDSWELDGPKVLESDNIILLLKDYRPLGDTRLEIKPCTLIVYVGGEDETKEELRPIILQAPQGAILTFDQEIDLGHASIGRLKRGVLQGPITIRSPETEPGADDALLMTTRNVQIDPRRVWTPHEVDIVYGSHEISGRDLIITLADAADTPVDSELAMGTGGLESIELVHVDKVRLQTGGSDLFGQATEAATDAEETGNKEEGWLEVACHGPFHFDMAQQVATFEEHVDIWRIHADGPSDQLSCELLSISFDAADADTTSYQLGKIVAEGHPVVLRAPSINASARGEWLEYDFKASRVTLGSSNQSILNYDETEVRSVRVQYEIVEGTQIGRIWAEGPGTFHTTLEEDGNSLTATWQDEFRVRPHEGMHVLSMTGQAVVHSSLSGSIESNEIHVWFREIPSPPLPETANISEEAKPSALSRIEPDRLMAHGNVTVDSQQLSGQTERLEMWFEYEDTEEPVATSDPAVRPPTTPPARPPSSPLLPQDSDRKYDVRGSLVRALLVHSNDKTHIENITIEGNVRLAEVYRGAPGESPLIVTGDLLQVRNADRESGVFHISGTPATVMSRGMTTMSKNIQIDRQANRLWIVGPGEMTATLERDLNGNEINSPEPVHILWRDGFDFDGQSAHIGQGVQISTSSQTATADRLDLLLSQRIDFAHPDLNGGQIEVRQIGLKQNVEIENRTIEDNGIVSIDRVHVDDIVVDQLTGLMRANGPGWLSTVRRSQSSETLFGVPPSGDLRPSEPSVNDSEQEELSYLRVEFSGHAEGNLNDKEIRFFDQIHTVYGAVAHWDETLSVERSNGPGGEEIRLDCDQLVVREMGTHPTGRAAIEIEAIGRTLVEGRAFTARAHRISYTEEKDLLVLEGDGRSPAELFHQTRVGGTVSRFAGRKILYGRTNNQIQVDDAQYLDLSEFGNFGG